MDPQTITSIVNAIVSTFTVMLTPAMGYLVIGSLMLTQAIKWIAIYLHKSMPRQMIFFVVSPSVTGLLSVIIWTDANVHWIAAALTASLFSNMAYALFLKKMLGKAAPEVYERINAPVDRRKHNARVKVDRRK